VGSRVIKTKSIKKIDFDLIHNIPVQSMSWRDQSRSQNSKVQGVAGLRSGCLIPLRHPAILIPSRRGGSTRGNPATLRGPIAAQTQQTRPREEAAREWQWLRPGELNSSHAPKGHESPTQSIFFVQVMQVDLSVSITIGITGSQEGSPSPTSCRSALWSGFSLSSDHAPLYRRPRRLVALCRPDFMCES
jgi:hypothetical protein